MAKGSNAGERPTAGRPAGTFVLRAPHLPRNRLDRWGDVLLMNIRRSSRWTTKLDRWGDVLLAPAALEASADRDQLASAITADREVLRARRAAIAARPQVREAICVASH